MSSIVVFDLGKVLVDFDYSIPARRLMQRARPSGNGATLFADQAALVFQYELGSLTTRQFFDEICRVTGYSGTFDDFGQLFANMFTAIAPMVEWHGTLRQRRIPCCIFSTTNELAIREIDRAFPFYRDFDDHVLSYEHGAMKPDARLYEVVERRTRRRGREILYIDDRPENIEAGAARGWQCVLHESPAQTLAAAAALLP